MDKPGKSREELAEIDFIPQRMKNRMLAAQDPKTGFYNRPFLEGLLLALGNDLDQYIAGRESISARKDSSTEMARRWEASARKTGEELIKMQAKLAEQAAEIARLQKFHDAVESFGTDACPQCEEGRITLFRTKQCVHCEALAQGTEARGEGEKR